MSFVELQELIMFVVTGIVQVQVQIQVTFHLKKGRQTTPEMEFKEFEPRFKSAKTRFKLSAGLNLKTFDTILSGTNHI